MSRLSGGQKGLLWPIKIHPAVQSGHNMSSQNCNIKVLTSFLVITTHICAISAQDMLNKTSKISSGFKRTSELYTLHRKHLIFAVNNICMKAVRIQNKYMVCTWFVPPQYNNIRNIYLPYQATQIPQGTPPSRNQEAGSHHHSRHPPKKSSAPPPALNLQGSHTVSGTILEVTLFRRSVGTSQLLRMQPIPPSSH
ncbi:hypothetical protein Fcan01_21954 [Folsomia candida]|uniref:Uncharacterized protein n=1 Tax=Folsomia candida TaxID=158441 RepID=A0A226DGC3_FOLCA|nr:hypothetical protein Fcan01_21954 [Folsomia candida]